VGGGERGTEVLSVRSPGSAGFRPGLRLAEFYNLDDGQRPKERIYVNTNVFL
jgi:hypothetical protein